MLAIQGCCNCNNLPDSGTALSSVQDKQPKCLYFITYFNRRLGTQANIMGLRHAMDNHSLLT